MNNETENLDDVRNNIGKMIRELNTKGEFDIAMRLRDEMNKVTRITNM
jgi:hypothetical protein